MRVLGIEGTAWAASAAIFDDHDGIVALESDGYTPDHGGIHPREAAEHMADALPTVIERVLTGESIDAVAFSRGPGLGPCLRVVGTAARTVAQVRNVPLVGVNHMIAHLEVGRYHASFTDPICLNASGANAHVLGHRGDRYRVLGETLDTGVGNAIDKFARHVGWSHPGGPKVEEHAKEGEYIELPYVVKGMDFSFSGIMSAAKAAYDEGEAIEDVCFSLQETIFAMLTEVSERALSLTGRNELVLGGGVGQNERLQSMLQTMCSARGAHFHAPESAYLRDNGAMIAILGTQMLAVDDTLAIADSTVRARYRPDGVTVTWRDVSTSNSTPESENQRGAEASVELSEHTVVKSRHAKAYRHDLLDQHLRETRTAAEARLLHAARKAGVPTPVIEDIDLQTGQLTLEFVGEEDLRDGISPPRMRAMGRHLVRLHEAGIVHGDATVRNVRVASTEPGIGGDGRVYVIDFGLGFYSDHVEDYAMDLHVLAQSLDGTVSDATAHLEAVLDGYTTGARDGSVDPIAVRRQLEEIGQRGRYR